MSKPYYVYPTAGLQTIVDFELLMTLTYAGITCSLLYTIELVNIFIVLRRGAIELVKTFIVLSRKRKNSISWSIKV